MTPQHTPEKAQQSVEQQPPSEKFMRLFHFSDNPQLQEYFVQMKGCYHDVAIHEALEKFVAWQSTQPAPEKQQSKQSRERESENRGIETITIIKNLIDSHNGEFQHGQNINYTDVLEIGETAYDLGYHKLNAERQELEREKQQLIDALRETRKALIDLDNACQSEFPGYMGTPLQHQTQQVLTKFNQK